MADVPALDGSGSWIVSRKDSGKVVFESFDRATVETLDGEKYVVETAKAYLCRVNGQNDAEAA